MPECESRRGVHFHGLLGLPIYVHSFEPWSASAASCSDTRTPIHTTLCCLQLSHGPTKCSPPLPPRLTSHKWLLLL